MMAETEEVQLYLVREVEREAGWGARGVTRLVFD